jgi:hypothetical protein
MNKIDEVLRSLGRIEGRLDGFCQVAERVSRLEMWQSWMKGGMAAIGTACAYLFRVVFHS